jgi:RNA polymerase sigma-70 factor, ECF subfamily
MNACSLLTEAAVIIPVTPEKGAAIGGLIDSPFRSAAVPRINSVVSSKVPELASEENAGDGQRIPDDLVSAWPDARLVDAIRAEPPDSRALDELAQRYWKALFSRCQLLTLNHAEASDLAQEAWCRVLRARRSLNPEGNFPGYLSTVALNIWRDRCRANRRAGAMGTSRLVSLETALSDNEGHVITLADRVPDLAALESGARATLMMDVDAALGQLSPLIRSVLVARYLSGESCAEIGRRHGRTEQTISGWVRQGVHELQSYFLKAQADQPNQSL